MSYRKTNRTKKDDNRKLKYKLKDKGDLFWKEYHKANSFQEESKIVTIKSKKTFVKKDKRSISRSLPLYRIHLVYKENNKVFILDTEAIIPSDAWIGNGKYIKVVIIENKKITNKTITLKKADIIKLTKQSLGLEMLYTTLGSFQDIYSTFNRWKVKNILFYNQEVIDVPKKGKVFYKKHCINRYGEKPEDWNIDGDYKKKNRILRAFKAEKREEETFMDFDLYCDEDLEFAFYDDEIEQDVINKYKNTKNFKLYEGLRLPDGVAKFLELIIDSPERF